MGLIHVCQLIDHLWSTTYYVMLAKFTFINNKKSGYMKMYFYSVLFIISLQTVLNVMG